jgi:DNA topoisomerase-3
MSTDLVITEKSSQARDVQAAVGNRYGQVLPAEGHLITLREPEEVNPAWKQWTPVLLRPEGLFGTKPAAGGNKASKLQAIKAALRSARRVWLATDCDREGQLIGQEILEFCQFRGDVMRVMFTAQDPQTIRDAFAKAKPNAEYGNLYAAAVARQQSDQIYNLSLTRTATVLIGRGERAVIGVGRVKTPTLAIVCRRELEIRAFRPETYFEVVATAHAAGGTFTMRHAPPERILKREDGAGIAARANGFSGPLSVKVEEKRQAPPRLHDLPSLQKVCGSRFGWTASKTLDVAQELYDGDGKKLITYPRAESRYLPESLIADVPKIVAALTAGQSFGSLPMPPTPIIRRGKQGHFWDKGLEGVSHHAIIPNGNTVGDLRKIWARLSGDERRLFMVVARSYLAALMPDFRYRQTTALLDVGGYSFRAVGRQPIEIGWRAAFGEEAEEDGRDGGEKDERQMLPPLRDGESVNLREPKVEAKETKPPPRYNEGTVIEAMANAWRFVENPEHRERLKEAKGIGTPATRAEVIQGLKRQEMLVASGKHIVPTERGLALFGVLEKSDQALVDPAVTAKLEFLLDEVLFGRRRAQEAIDAVCGQAARIIGRLLAGTPSGGALLPAASSKLSTAARGSGKSHRRTTRNSGPPVPEGSGQSGNQVPRARPASGKARPAGALDGSALARGPFAEKTSRTKGRATSEGKLAGQGEGQATPLGPKRQDGARKRATRKAAGIGDARLSSGTEDGTPLTIPFGNKEVALRLGARYRTGGWFAPPGTNLEPFKDKGWL